MAENDVDDVMHREMNALRSEFVPALRACGDRVQSDRMMIMILTGLFCEWATFLGVPPKKLPEMLKVFVDDNVDALVQIHHMPEELE